MEKLSIIVPYRDRESHLAEFVPFMEGTKFLENLEFDILIVEQKDGKPFNRGKLLNIGAKESKSSDYYCFHDVDMLPINSDYSFVSNPTHLASEVEQFGFELPYPGYFGGVTIFSKSDFIRANGYSNDYWGWGAEDDDIMHRCVIKGLKPSRKNGRYRSLNHTRSIKEDLYNKNLKKYLDFKNSQSYEKMEQIIDGDGLNTLDYEILSFDRISEKTTRIRTRL